MGEDPRLAGPGAGEHEQRPLAVRDRLALGGFSSASRRSTWRRAGSGRPRSPGPRHGHAAEHSSARQARRGARPLSRRLARAPLGPQLAHLALGAGSPVELGEPPLELADPLREPLDRVGDRVGEVDPVGVGPSTLRPRPAPGGRGCRPPSSSAGRPGSRPCWRRPWRRARPRSGPAAWRRSRS